MPKLKLILMSNAAYKAYDYELPQPASLSERVVEGLLRVKLGYRGLVLADLSGAPSTGAYMIPDLADANVRSLRAGCDLIVARDRSATDVMNSIGTAVESGKIMPDRIEEALERQARVQEPLCIPGREIAGAVLASLARQFESFEREIGAREES
jgi:beta-N-acetylhexosaminidase